MGKNTLLLSIALAIFSQYCFSQQKTPLYLNDTYWPPYLFPADNTEYKGIAKELLNHCLKDANFDIRYLNLPIKRTHFYMGNGELDITIYSFKENRKEFLVYGKEPIFNVDYGFVVSKNRDINVTRLSDLKPLVIGHLSGLSHTPELLKIIEDKIPFQTVVESNNLVYMMRQLVSDPPRIDIIPNALNTFLWQIKTLNLGEDLKVLDYIVRRKAYYITVSKATRNINDIDEFLTQMDRCLVEYKKSSEYKVMLTKYGL